MKTFNTKTRQDYIAPDEVKDKTAAELHAHLFKMCFQHNENNELNLVFRYDYSGRDKAAELLVTNRDSYKVVYHSYIPDWKIYDKFATIVKDISRIMDGGA